MRPAKLTLAVVFTLFAASGTAHAIDYCGGHPINNSGTDLNQIKFVLNNLHEGKNITAADVLQQIYRALCAANTRPNERQPIEEIRRSFLTELGLTEEDALDATALVPKDDEHTPQYLHNNGMKAKEKVASRVPAEQVAYLSSEMRPWFYGNLWIVDAMGSRLTESARARFVMNCLHRAERNVESAPLQAAIDYSICSEDAHRLDRARYVAEVKVLPPGFRLAAKMEFSALQKQIAEFDAKIKENAKAAKIAIEIPHKVAEDWAAFATANRATLDIVDDVELNAVDKQESPDCMQKLAAPWKRALKETKVDMTSPPWDRIGETRLAYITAAGMFRCAKESDGLEGLTDPIAKALYLQPLARGPRTQAMLDAYQALKEKDRKTVSFPRMESYDLEFLPISQNQKTNNPRSAAYTVASVQKSGDKATVKFKKEWMDYAVCEKQQLSNRWKINGRGELEQIVDCTKIGARRELVQVPPADMPASLAAMLRPGMAVVLSTTHVPVEIWENNKQHKLVGLLGVPFEK